VGRKCCLTYFIYFVFCRSVRGKRKWQRNGCDITCLYYFGSDIKTDLPTPRCITQHLLFQTISLQREDRYRGFGRGFWLQIICQLWDLFRTFLWARLILQRKIPLYTNVTFEALQTVLYIIRFDNKNKISAVVVSWTVEIRAFFPCAQWRHAMRPSPQHGFQNGGRSNCSGTELFAATIRLKGKFTS